MPSNIYVVKKGDTLWDISLKYLDSPYEWPRIWRHNNRKDIIAVTGKGIKNPDLIYPGQKLLLPLIDTKQPTNSGIKSRQPSRSQASQSNSLMEKLKDIKTPIAIKYNLEEIALPPIIHPKAIIEVKMTGSVILSSKDSLPVTYVTNRDDIELNMTAKANHAFGSLVSDLQVAHDRKSGKVTMGMSLISKSNTPNIPTTVIGITADSDSPVPKIKYEIKLPELKGTIGDFNFVAANSSVSIEVTPTGDKPLTSDFQPIDDTSVEMNPKWVATGLAVGGTLLIVGTLIEDFFTGGIGTADDPASFAGAAVMYARSAALWRGSSVVVQRALLPVMTRIKITVVPVGTAIYAH